MALVKVKSASYDTLKLLSETLDIISENHNLNKDEVWSLLSDKPLDNLLKSKKPKKKRAKTAYSMFSADTDVRKTIEDSNGGKLPIGKMSKLISDKWKSLSESEKAVYEDKAKEMNEKNPPDIPVKKKHRTVTAYNKFLGDKDLRTTIQNDSKDPLTMGQVNDIMIAKWKSMTDKDKAKYVKQAEDENKKNSEVNNTSEPVKEDTSEPVKEDTSEPVKEEVKDTVPVKKKNPAKKKSATKK